MTAKISIQVGDTIYLPGQTVSGLSETDISWMSAKGYIELPKKSQKKADAEKGEKTSDTKKPDEVSNVSEDATQK